MKLQFEITLNEKRIERFWQEHPNLRTLDSESKLPSYEACIVREMSAAVEFDGIGYVTGTTLVTEEEEQCDHCGFSIGHRDNCTEKP